MRALKQDVRTVLIVLGVIALIGGPAVAAIVADYAKNSDKVDGKHAVGSSASNTQAKNRLVAAGGGGKFAAKFIPKVASAAHADQATSADALDGLDSTQFMQGGGRAIETSQTLQSNSSIDVINVPGFGRFLMNCSSDLQMYFFGEGAPGGRVWVDTGATDPAVSTTVAGPGGIGTQAGPYVMNAPGDMHVWEFDNPKATATIVSTFTAGAPNTCYVKVRLVIH